MLKFALATVAIAAAMIYAKEGEVLQRSGLLSSCSPVAAANGDEGAWQACRSGKLDGRPNLSRNSCRSQGIVASLEYWSCPAPISTDRRTG